MPLDRSYDYDVCLSFAGEERTYVEQVVKNLALKEIRVFYDLDEQVSLWGKDLYDHLSEIYRDRAFLCVIFVSEAYAAKQWTTHERHSAQARAVRENREYILPVRFDDTELPGLNPTIGYIDLRGLPPDRLADLIATKLHQVRIKHSQSGLITEASDLDRRPTEKPETAYGSEMPPLEIDEATPFGTPILTTEPLIEWLLRESPREDYRDALANGQPEEGTSTSIDRPPGPTKGSKVDISRLDPDPTAHLLNEFEAAATPLGMPPLAPSAPLHPQRHAPPLEAADPHLDIPPSALPSPTLPARAQEARQSGRSRWFTIALIIVLLTVTMLDIWLKLKIQDQKRLSATLLSDLRLAESWDRSKEINDAELTTKEAGVSPDYKSRDQEFEVSHLADAASSFLSSLSIFPRRDTSRLTLVARTSEDLFVAERDLGPATAKYLDTEVQQVSGDTTSYACLLFRGSEGFCLSRAGYAHVSRRPGQRIRWVLKSRHAVALHSSPTIPNRLTVIKTDNHIAFCINGREVNRFVDSSPDLGTAGFGIFFEKSGRAEFNFLNPRVRI